MGYCLKALALCGALFVIACASVDETIYVDSAFTPAAQRAIEAGARLWSEAKRDAVRLDLVFGERLPAFKRSIVRWTATASRRG